MSRSHWEISAVVAGLALGLLLACTGAHAQTINPLAGKTVDVARDFSAKCDGATDDTAAFARAFAAADVVHAPSRPCYSATGIVVPPNKVLRSDGLLLGNPVPSTTFSIECPHTLAAPCLTAYGASGSNGLLATTLENVTVQGIGGTPVSGAIGIKWYNGFAAIANNVKITSFDTCGLWEAGSVSGGGISFHSSMLYESKCQTHRLVDNGWAEITITGGRYGEDGTGDYQPQDFWLFENTTCLTAGCGPNTVKETGVQLNAGNGDGAVCPLRFANYNGDGVLTDFVFDDDRFEMHNGGVTAFLCSDSSVTRLNGLILSNLKIDMGGTSAPFVALNAATALSQVHFINDVFGGCSGITLAPAPASGAGFSDVFISNVFGCTLASFTSNGTGGNRLYLQGNNWGAMTIAGAWDGQLQSGDYYSSLADTATGNVYMQGPLQTWTQTLDLCSVAGCGTSAGTQTSSGQYQRTPDGGFTAYFYDQMTGAPGSGNLEISNLPLACTPGAAAASSVSQVQTFSGMLALKSPLIAQLGTNTPPSIFFAQLNATGGSGTATVQLAAANISSSTLIGGSVHCPHAK